MPELPKFDDEDLKSYGDEEEESALCVFFSFSFLLSFSLFLLSVRKVDFQQSSVCQKMLKEKNKMVMTVGV